MVFDYSQQLADMQTALRALWPDRAKVYFTWQAAEDDNHQGVLLTEEEQGLLHRVTLAIGAARNSEEQISRTTAEIEEAAVFDFLNWLTAQHITLVEHWGRPAASLPLPEGELWGRWKTERHL